ncbi:spore germination protein [Ectobacillus ponti]|uniref:Spore germination protein n=1 Tax=Ectobacillus ponti TaxID=2961894 RepID=A0AA41X763_9BACI|nr:spore germination protein [Ectobacillus ponti]MCP8967879.1 spore germination protein [Ectobacillus ponti]
MQEFKEREKQEQTISSPLSESLYENLRRIRTVFQTSHDVVIRELRIGEDKNIPIVIVYTDGLASSQSVSGFILDALLVHTPKVEGVHNPEKLFELMSTSILAGGEVKPLSDFEKLYLAVLAGETVVLLDGCAKALMVSTRGWKDRGVQEPTVQTVIRGPREAFSESLRTNTALVRRRVKDENLHCEQQAIGRITKTDIAVMYIEGIANEKIVKELFERLERIDTDGILESGYIEEFIQDSYLTPFPLTYNTERPDVVAGGLLEGRVAILVDGTPFALLVPVLFGQFFQSAEDYYQRSMIATAIRLLRYVCFFIALLAPSLYIAATTFHQEMLPTQLLISLASQREGIPFPAFVEALIMELTFEILREAGIRMPRPMGQAISIVGALVVGQAAVEAGFVSAAMVIVVSITAISTFVFPSYEMAIPIRVLRFLMMLLAASFGLFGITMGLLGMVLHLCSLRSFGAPYMAPFSPIRLAGQKDMIFRLPHWSLRKRPAMISKENPVRDATPAPAPPRPEGEQS